MSSYSCWSNTWIRHFFIMKTAHYASSVLDIQVKRFYRYGWWQSYLVYCPIWRCTTYHDRQHVSSSSSYRISRRSARCASITLPLLRDGRFIPSPLAPLRSDGVGLRLYCMLYIQYRCQCKIARDTSGSGGSGTEWNDRNDTSLETERRQGET